jgi:hypothetical protein
MVVWARIVAGELMKSGKILAMFPRLTGFLNEE